MADRKTAAGRPGAPRGKARRRSDDKPDLLPARFSISDGSMFWARLIDEGISGAEVESIVVEPVDGSPSFTVEGLEGFIQMTFPVTAPDRTGLVSQSRLAIRWERGVSTADRTKGIASGKLKITIRPAGSVAADRAVEHVYEPIDVYID